MKRKVKVNFKWVLRTAAMTFVLAVVFSIVSETLIRRVNIVAAFLLLLLIIFIGVFFDAIGIAVAAGDERPFHAMASAKIPRAKYALRLIKNASQVSNFCNDVIGDIAGIISGATIGIIMSFIENTALPTEYHSVMMIAFSGLVASLTVGGKAIGKDVAMSRSKDVIDIASRVLYYSDKVFSIKTYTRFFK